LAIHPANASSPMAACDIRDSGKRTSCGRLRDLLRLRDRGAHLQLRLE
jgi:hypothetical protein